ncbi:MAG: class I tRNA ligase family protein, partial [Deltaproteobacteria bacterium]|nr:class I tRNA ligase family protein [Deltaproteobacteria bacterium]
MPKFRFIDDLEFDEERILEEWDANGCFKFDPNSSRESFVFILPPPNANGELHLGHAFGYTIMDLIGRYQRQEGKNVLLLPGKDHAGIQTQVIFEKILESQGVSPKSLTRDQLFKRCYEFCMDRARYMRAQEKSLGLSADWNYELFTLDPRVSDEVLQTFINFYNDGLAYRADRLVNWSIVSQTSISDIEVEYVERKGKLFFILYPWSDQNFDKDEMFKTDRLLADKLPKLDAQYEVNDAFVVVGSDLPEYGIINNSVCVHYRATNLKELKISNQPSPCGIYLRIRQTDRGVVVATTRPETMLGDVAVAVNPEDPRYREIIGKEVIVPEIDRVVKIVAHDAVDPTFGTGVLKITPGHDFLDYKIGKDLNLNPITVISKDGRINENGGLYAGLEISDAREKIIKNLTIKQLLLEEKEIVHNVPVSERAKDLIEPLITEQWWLSLGNLAKEALKRLEAGEIEIYPKEFKDLIIRWFLNLEDWNISRQLWWGHRIPVWYKDGKVYRVCKESVDNATPEQDTFDTWFSSGQWPFTTLIA